MILSLNNSMQIRTPEGVGFAMTLAGPVSRLLAWLLDSLLAFAVGFLASIALALVGVISPDLANAMILLLWFVVQVGYCIAFEWWWRGQTPGKRMMKLRVVDARGSRLTFNQVLMRNLLRFVDALPGLYLVGGLALWISRGSQRLGDLAANTLVIQQHRQWEPDWEGLEPGKYNSLLAMPHLVARLRQRLAPEAAYLAVRALLRRQDLESEARVELFREAAALFRREAAFPAELLEGMSDEQFVRNVVEALFRRVEDRKPSAR
jgi:uncharacterized RDD family membrane protein YckC